MIPRSPTVRRVLPILALALLSLLLSAVAGAQERAPRSPLRLQTATFDPLYDGEPAAALAGAPDPAAGDYVIVQFVGPVEPAWVEQAEALGVELLGYLPENAYAARVAPADLARLRSLPAVRWVGPYRAAYKLAPALAAGPRLAADAPLEVALITFPGEPAAGLEQRLLELGASIQELTDTSIGVFARATLSAAALEELSRYPAVSWIEPYVEARLHNAEGRKLMGVESIWQSGGLFGAGQIIAISDSGLSVQGQLSGDFGDRLIRAYTPAEMLPGSEQCAAKNNWTDLNGHGTHVAGSVLGSGLASGSNPAARQFTGSHAGAAPEARMVFMAMNTDGSTSIQCIPANGNYIGFGYQNGARISTNSWGFNTNGAYTLNDSVVDDYIWRNRDYLVLFAAGNAGPGPNTIGSPGNAKNIIAVGASENNRPDLGPDDPVSGGSISDDPATMAYFSSRGPTDDGRIKPDIVAPGTNVLSVLGAEAGGLTPFTPGSPYALSSGTSMATPLTAGAASLVREWLITQRGVAEPSAALLKALLIHGAVQLPQAATPNPSSGWGRVDLKNTVNARYTHFVDDLQGLTTGQRRSFTIEVGGSSPQGTLFVAPPQLDPAAAATTSFATLPPAPAANAQPPLPADVEITPLPGHERPRAGSPLPDDGGAPRESRRPASAPLPAGDPVTASELTTTPAGDPSAQSLLHSMVGGGDFEDPAWTNLWSKVWFVGGNPLRVSNGALSGAHSAWLGGSPSNDALYYPVSFPDELDDSAVSSLRFLLRMTDLDPTFDYFCWAITDETGLAIGSGTDQLRACGHTIPSGIQQVTVNFTPAHLELLAGETGYLTLYTYGDGAAPHMSAVVDNIFLNIDFPDVTLEAAPGAGPAGSTFLLFGSYNVPYGAVDICVATCANGPLNSAPIYADARGDLRAYLTTGASWEPGAYTVISRNVAGRTAATTVTILGASQPTLTVTPASGPAGTVFAFEGADLLPNDSAVTVRLNGSVVGTTGSDGAGTVRFRLTTSSNTPAGTYEVQVSDSAGRGATASYQVTAVPGDAPTMTVSPASGPAGTAFSFSGSGFAGGESVSFALDGQAVGAATPDGAGRFTVTLSTSPQIAPGSYTLEAAQGARRASASFAITGGQDPGGGTPPSGSGIHLTLVWTDPPGQPGAERALVNDLNLRLEGPGGQVYLGNGGETADSLNNVETIKLERPQPGLYTVVVEGASVSAAFGSQPFALLATTAQSYGASSVDTGDVKSVQRIFLPLLRR
jgi:hypothetical protein